MKPKSNRKPGKLDLCQTPNYALDPLVPHLKRAKFRTIWECASGEGLLASALRLNGFDVVDTDILDSYGHDFFEYYPGSVYDCIVTNPPYSLKYEWTQRCYDLGKPFALLMPVEMLGTVKGGDMFKAYGVQVIFMRPRINYKMPKKGWGGAAQFPTAWFTWQLKLPKDNLFVRITRR